MVAVQSQIVQQLVSVIRYKKREIYPRKSTKVNSAIESATAAIRRSNTIQYHSRPEQGESSQQFIVRVNTYFLRWIELAKVDQSFDGVRSLIVRERYLGTNCF